MDFLLFCIAAALVIIGVTLVFNVFLFPRLRASQEQFDLPRVSVLIPARDESAVIFDTLQRLNLQEYPDFEIIVLDDNSVDETSELARAVGGRVQVIAGEPLSPGWAGKNWACHQLAAHATGEILLFTDADVVWRPGSLRAMVAEIQRTRADLLTIWPTQLSQTWAERLTVPLISLVVLGYLPVWAVHHIPVSALAAANGQCMAWRYDAYSRTGGHEAVRSTVLEDVTLARRVKSLGLRLRMADGANFVACRMYTDWPSVRNGFAKSILAGFGGVLPLLASTLFHWMLFLYPIFLLCLSLVPQFGLTPYAAQAFLLTLLGIVIRAVSAAWTNQRPLDAFLMPLSVFLMTVITAQALLWHFKFGGPQWKGRVVSPRPLWYRGVGGKG
jgi:chlorobactene glucosyltransferase